MTLWSANHSTIRVINTPTVSYITSISVIYYTNQCGMHTLFFTVKSFLAPDFRRVIFVQWHVKIRQHGPEKNYVATV